MKFIMWFFGFCAILAGVGCFFDTPLVGVCCVLFGIFVLVCAPSSSKSKSGASSAAQKPTTTNTNRNTNKTTTTNTNTNMNQITTNKTEKSGFCKNCGKPLGPDASFCGYCGWRVH